MRIVSKVQVVDFILLMAAAARWTGSNVVIPGSNVVMPGSYVVLSGNPAPKLILDSSSSLARVKSVRHWWLSWRLSWERRGRGHLIHDAQDAGVLVVRRGSKGLFG